MLLIALAAIPVLIWIYLLIARGEFWRVSRHLVPDTIQIAPAKRVIAVIPARNEAAVIGHALESLFAQELPGSLHIVVVDDGSSDGTAEIATGTAKSIDKAAALTIVDGQALQPGWTGKLWALSQGVVCGELLAPDYFLFTDADIRHGPEAVSQLLAMAEARHYDLASYMVKLACVSTAEKALIPAFVFFFLKLYPPSWIASERSKTAGAAGGCILIRADVLNKIGGIARIKNEVIDDCALARAVKNSGGRIWMGLTAGSESIRSYGSLSEIGSMISRTAFNQLHHSSVLLAAAISGLFLTYLLAPLLLFTGKAIPMSLGFAAWLLMSICYLPMVRFYRRSVAWSIALPPIALFYLCATIDSAVRYWRGRGGEWKGRFQDAPKRL